MNNILQLFDLKQLFVGRHLILEEDAVLLHKDDVVHDLLDLFLVEMQVGLVVSLNYKHELEMLFRHLPVSLSELLPCLSSSLCASAASTSTTISISSR